MKIKLELELSEEECDTIDFLNREIKCAANDAIRQYEELGFKEWNSALKFINKLDYLTKRTYKEELLKETNLK